MNEIDESEGLLPELDVSNVCVFMADALRWDYLPKSIRERGTTIKTVAASLTTHTSIPSMISGIRPNRHGVFSWEQQMPEVDNMLEHSGFDCGYFMPGENENEVLADGTFSVLRQDSRTRIEDLEEPWFYFERHHGGHAPYGKRDYQDFVNHFAGDPDKIQKGYQDMVDSSVQDFNRRVATIKEEHNLNDTLVVFTSDHGEYLGEQGLVSHNYPLRPEGAYVPTTFIHPELPSSEVSGMMRHIDLYPTILSMVGDESENYVDGVDLQCQKPFIGSCVSRLTSNKLNGREVFNSIGVWDEEGGVVWNNTGRLNKALVSIDMILDISDWSWQSKHLKRKPEYIPRAIQEIVSNHDVYGSPKFNPQEAKEWIESLEEEPVAEVIESELSEETKERLEGWGYL